jgi:hypothetical protein
MKAEQQVSYVAGGDVYLYPSLGDARPPSGADVLLLNRGGVCIRGKWRDDGSVIAWAPFPKRDRAKEAQIRTLSITP